MSDKHDNPFGKKGQDIDTGLNGLFNVLGPAIAEIASKLEDGKSGTISRDHVFETENGPMRAHAGIRLRMGGMERSEASAPKPQPVNHKSRAKPSDASPAKTTSNPTSLPYDMFEDSDDWVLTADMPGVSRKDLTLTRDGSELILQTNGARRYHARIPLADDFDIAQISTSLRNGILALKIPKVSQ